MKKILIGLAIVLALIGGAVIYVATNLDGFIKTAVETGGSRVTGVEVSLDDVTLDLTDGKAALSGLTVGNPEGFNTDYAVALGGVSVEIDTNSIGSDTIIIKSVRVDSPKVIYELAGTVSNVNAIQSNVERFTGGTGGDSSASSAGDADAEGSEGPGIIIEDLVIAGGEVGVSAGFLAGKKLAVSLPEIHLSDLGKNDGESGATPAEIAAEIMAALNDQILGSVGKLDLTGMMEGAGEMVEDGAKAAADAMGDIGSETGAAAGDAVEGASEAVGGALKSILGDGN